jgi:methylglyoxal reductase
VQYRKLGASGISTSVVGLGTWVTGGGAPWGADPDDAESVQAIHAALDGGVNMIDTAPAYGFGRSEEVVGKAIQSRRDQVILATKCGLWWADDRGSAFCDYDGRAIRRSLRPDTIREEIELSLRRLQTDVIDLYQTHWPAVEPDNTPIADTMACLMKLKDEGKIRAIGVSNVTLEELEANARHGEVSTNQPRYSMLFRDIETEILPWCVANNVATLAYMPLEQGLLTGKVTLDRTFSPDEWRSNHDWNPWFKRENLRQILSMLKGWQDLTVKYGCTLAQLTIAWTIAQPGVTVALCGARRVDQAIDNAGAGNLQLEPADVARMRNDVLSLGEPS